MKLKFVAATVMVRYGITTGQNTVPMVKHCTPKDQSLHTHGEMPTDTVQRS